MRFLFSAIISSLFFLSMHLTADNADKLALRRIISSIKNEENETAEALIHNFHSQYSTSKYKPRIVWLQAELSLKKQDYRKALDLFISLPSEIYSEKIYNQVLLCCISLKDFEPLQHYFNQIEKSILTSTDMEQYRLFQARCYLAQKNNTDKIKESKRLLTSLLNSSYNKEALKSLVELELFEKNYSLALYYIQKLESLGEKSSKLLITKGICLTNTQQYHEADSLFRGLSSNKDSPKLVYNYQYTNLLQLCKQYPTKANKLLLCDFYKSYLVDLSYDRDLLKAIKLHYFELLLELELDQEIISFLNDHLKLVSDCESKIESLLFNYLSCSQKMLTFLEEWPEMNKPYCVTRALQHYYLKNLNSKNIELKATRCLADCLSSNKLLTEGERSTATELFFKHLLNESYDSPQEKKSWAQHLERLLLDRVEGNFEANYRLALAMGWQGKLDEKLKRLEDIYKLSSNKNQLSFNCLWEITKTYDEQQQFHSSISTLQTILSSYKDYLSPKAEVLLRHKMARSLILVAKEEKASIILKEIALNRSAQFEPIHLQASIELAFLQISKLNNQSGISTTFVNLYNELNDTSTLVDKSYHEALKKKPGLQRLFDAYCKSILIIAEFQAIKQKSPDHWKFEKKLKDFEEDITDSYLNSLIDSIQKIYDERSLYTDELKKIIQAHL